MHHVTCFTFQPFKKVGCHYGPWAPMHSCLFILNPFAEKRRDNKISKPKMTSLHQKLTVQVQIQEIQKPRCCPENKCSTSKHMSTVNSCKPNLYCSYLKLVYTIVKLMYSIIKLVYTVVIPNFLK